MTSPYDGLEGREAASLVRVMLVLTAGAAGLIGLLLAGLSGHTKDFAWTTASPVTAVLVAAGFVGAVPMLLYAATRLLWEHLRVPWLAATTVLLGLLGVTAADVRHTNLKVDLVPMVIALVWILGVAGLAVGQVASLPLQLREPGLPLARIAPIPRWASPLIAVQGSALGGLGAGLLAGPHFWGGLLPWPVDDFDARILGAWCLALGVALLAALSEDDLARLRAGLVGISCIGALALAGLGWRHQDVAWGTASAWLMLVLLAGLTATGVIGLGLERRLKRRSGDAQLPSVIAP